MEKNSSAGEDCSCVVKVRVLQLELLFLFLTFDSSEEGMRSLAPHWESSNGSAFQQCYQNIFFLFGPQIFHTSAAV